MIDWVTAVIPLRHAGDIFGNRVFCTTPSGEIRWETRSGVSVEGSYSSKIEVKSNSPNEVYIKGNPVKLFQGHNVFGTDDLIGLTAATMERICATLGIEINPADRKAWWEGDYQLKRVDVNYGYMQESRADVHSWLRAMEQHGYQRRRGRGEFRGQTLYFGKPSRVWSIKGYSKGEELEKKGRGIPCPIFSPLLLNHADKLLRLEVVLRSQELKRLNLSLASRWRIETPPQIYEAKVATLEIAENYRVRALDQKDMPEWLHTTYLLWEAGHDLRAHYSKAKFYRHRAQLRKAYGIDIAVKQNRDTSLDNVIPLRRVIEAVPAGVPEWANGTTMYFEPRRSVGEG